MQEPITSGEIVALALAHGMKYLSAAGQIPSFFEPTFSAFLNKSSELISQGLIPLFQENDPRYHPVNSVVHQIRV